jgi:hypothetical protein
VGNTVPPAYSHVFVRFKGRRDLQDGWEAWCPSHEDERPGGNRSLSVKLGSGGKLLIRCHGPGGGCQTKEILDALGLDFDDLYPDNKAVTGGRKRMEGEKREFVCAYDYRDEKGVVLFQVVRWRKPDGGKTFSQRRPNPAYDRGRPRGQDNPEWLSGVEGVRRVLYKLPELTKALRERPDRWVFVHEGEKAADAAWKFGLVSTCSPMGAGKWNDEAYCQPLRDRNVCVIEDDDPVDDKLGHEPGERHARDVCLSLCGWAKTLKKVRLSDVKDKSDFFDWQQAREGNADKVRGELAELVKAAPDWQPRPEDFPRSLKKLLGCMHRRRMREKRPFASREEVVGATVMAYQSWLTTVPYPVPHDEACEWLAAVIAQGMDERPEHEGLLPGAGG